MHVNSIRITKKTPFLYISITYRGHGGERVSQSDLDTVVCAGRVQRVAGRACDAVHTVVADEALNNRARSRPPVVEAYPQGRVARVHVGE